MLFKRKGETYLCEQVTDSACARGLYKYPSQSVIFIQCFSPLSGSRRCLENIQENMNDNKDGAGHFSVYQY